VNIRQNSKEFTVSGGLSTTQTISVPDVQSTRDKIRGGVLVLITNYQCSLRCRDCGNFIPYVPGHFKRFYRVEQIKLDIDALSKVMNVNKLQLQGGESLLHPNLDQIIAVVAKSAIASYIELTTNATLLMDDKVLKACRDFSVEVRISDYGAPKQKVSELVAQCSAAQIPYSIYEMAAGNNFWYSLAGLTKERNSDNGEVTTVFKSCPYRSCWTVVDGFFTKCSRAPMGHLVGLHEFFPQDSVYIRTSSEELKSHLVSFLAPFFMECCRYCNGARGTKIPAGVQLK